MVSWERLDFEHNLGILYHSDGTWGLYRHDMKLQSWVAVEGYPRFTKIENAYTALKTERGRKYGLGAYPNYQPFVSPAP